MVEVFPATLARNLVHLTSQGPLQTPARLAAQRDLAEQESFIFVARS